ncbi:MAG: hypothetical protein AB7O96_01015 [Pseudobdellovibrionaceae bacterium]
MAENLSDQCKRWKNRIAAGKSVIDSQKKDWEKYDDAYEGRILSEANSDFNGQLCQINYAYVDMRSSVPKLYTKNPYIFIDPETPEADLNAEVLEKVINAKLDEWHLKSRMQELIKGTKGRGRGYIKVSYKFDKDKIGREFVGDEPNDEITLNYITREDLILPKDAKNANSARWAVHRIKAPIKDIRQKFKLSKTDKPNVECDSYAEDKSHISAEEKEDFQYGTYYEIENREDHTLAIIVDGVEGWVEKPYKHPYGFFTMYVPLEWNDMPHDLDTKADLHFWYPQLLELAENETQQHHHGRKLNAKYKAKGSALTEDQINDLQTYKDSTFVQLKADQDIEPFQHAVLGQEVYLRAQSLRQDITVISGINEMKQGLPQAQKTAREAMAIVAESQDVVGYRASKVEDAVAEIIKKCIWLIQNFYDSTRVISLTGMDEVEFLGFKDKLKDNKSKTKLLGTSKKPFLEFVGKDLMGKMRVKVKAGSTQPVNEEQRKADIAQLTELMGKSPQIAAGIDSKELLKEIGKLLHLENKRITLDTTSPEQENILLKRNIPVLPNMNEDHAQHLASHDLENNNTPAFLMHTFAHRLMKSFLEKSQFYGQVDQKQMPAGPGGLSQNNISGMPQGSSVPPQAMPQQPTPNSGPQVQQQPQVPA